MQFLLCIACPHLLHTGKQQQLKDLMSVQIYDVSLCILLSCLFIYFVASNHLKHVKFYVRILFFYLLNFIFFFSITKL